MTTPELEAEREFIATRLCVAHQATAATRIPCASCTQEVDTLVDEVHREMGERIAQDIEEVRDGAVIRVGLMKGEDAATMRGWIAAMDEVLDVVRPRGGAL